MEIKGKRVLVLGGWGLVGAAVCRKILKNEPSELIVASLQKSEAEEACEKLKRGYEGHTRMIPAGGNIFVNAPVASDLLVAAGNLTLSTSVAGDVEAYVGMLRMTTNAAVNGDLTYTSEEELSMAPGSTVSGDIIRKTPPISVEPEGIPSITDFTQNIYRLRLQLAMMSYFSALIIGLILLRFFPNYMKSVSEELEGRTLRSLGIGFGALVITPLVFFVLLLTLIGIPIAFILMFFYIIYIYLSKIFVGYFIGGKIKSIQSQYLAFALGLLIFYIATIIPVLGGFVRFFGMVFGFGAMLIACWEYYKKANKAKLL